MNTKKLTVGALTGALILVATAFIKIPSPQGYIHIGDAIIIISAFILGPACGISAAIGSFLADLLAGYPQYMAVTFVIKGLLGLFCGLAFLKIKPFFLKVVVICVSEMVLVLGGYFVFEWIFYKSLKVAFGNSAFTLWQCVIGLIVGLCVTGLLRDKKLFKF